MTKEQIKFIVKIFGAISFFVGAVVVFINWRVGVSILLLWLFLTGSVLTWLTDSSVPQGTSEDIKVSIQKTIKVSYWRALILALFEIGILCVIWFVL